MKKKQKIEVILLLLGMVFAVSGIDSFNIIDNEENKENQNDHYLKRPKLSGAYTEPFIHIDGSIPGNWTATLAESWCNLVNSKYVIENVTIDASSSPTGSGIFINNSKKEYFIIRNCTVYNSGTGAFDAGIKLENTDNGTLTLNNCSNNGFLGIFLYQNCKNNTLFGNIAKNKGTTNQDRGIYLQLNCDNNTISENIANENLFNGIYLYDDCDNNIISGNTASNIETSNQDRGINLNTNCDNNTISGNNLNNNTERGIYVRISCKENYILENNVSDNIQYGIFFFNGCNNNTISDNILSNIGTSNQNTGIFFSTSCNINIIKRNNISDNSEFGIHFFTSCTNNTISDNICTSNQNTGIFFSTSCNYNVIKGNNITENIQHGMYIYSGSQYNNIWGNFVNKNEDYGIYIDQNSDGNTIFKNTIFENGIYGIRIRDSSNDNLIYLNAFIGNVDNAIDHVINNHWDNDFIGNYWDDYSGSDLFPMDGIGDTPYPIPIGEYDTKPLMYLGWDTDGDSFCDSDEVTYNTDPLDPLWYPMPNLEVSHFSPIFTYNTTSYVLDFSITNNGIWRAEGIIITVRCEELELTLFNNTISPITLDVDESEYIAVNCLPFEQIGTFYLNLTIDPDNIISETYSAKNGSLRTEAEKDNSQIANITIIPEVIAIIPDGMTLNLAILSQSFSINEFNISLLIQDDFGQNINYALIQLWWNSTDVSTNVQNLGSGLYFISLEPITVIPGEEPIILEILISADGYEDKYYETFLAVDPDTLDKDIERRGEQFPFLIIIITTISVVGSIGAAVTIVLLRKRKGPSEIV